MSSLTPSTTADPKRTINANLAEDLALAKAGDAAAVQRITLDNFPLLLSFCKKLNLFMEFDDRVQEAAMRMPVIIANFDPARGIKFSTYVCKSLVRWLRRLDSESRIVRVPISAHDRGTVHARAAVHRNVDFGRIAIECDENPVDETELTLAMRHAMQKIDPRLRLAVHLRFYEGQKLREVGSQLGVTRERARQLIIEGVAQLHKILKRSEAA